MRISHASVLVIGVATLSGCALFSPYTPVAERFCTEPEPLPGSGRAESCHFSKTFEFNAQSTAYFSSGSTVALAGVLGLGAYKSIVASSGHQFVALAAGGGALYGTGLALYKPTREQIWMGGSAALSCLDNFYRDLDPAVGTYYFNKLTAVQKQAIEVDYLRVLGLTEMYDDQYKANVRSLANSINRLISTLQPTAAESYSAVSGAIGDATDDINKGQFKMKLAPGAQAISEDARRLSIWMSDAINRHKDITDNHLKPQCAIFSSDFVIADFPSDGKLTIKKDTKKQYTILDGSGFFNIKKSPDSTNVVAKFVSENKVRLIIIEGKAVTTEPIFVTFIDSETGISRTLEVTVEQ